MKNENPNTNTGPNRYKVLDKMFDRLIRETLNNIDEEHGERWETYDLILFELKREYNYETYDEIKYRLTDGENPTDVFYDIIMRGEYSSSLIWLFKGRLETYLEEDYYSRFYK